MAALTDLEKKHLSLVITGHVDSGKSTITGRLLTLLGGVSERELEKLKAEAAALGKESFLYAFVMDKQKDERARGITIACTSKEFFTPNFHYTIIDAPGHRDFVKVRPTDSTARGAAHCRQPVAAVAPVDRNVDPLLCFALLAVFFFRVFFSEHVGRRFAGRCGRADGARRGWFHHRHRRG
jgi:translation elongation factor EF-Tu-like GTPase